MSCPSDGVHLSGQSDHRRMDCGLFLQLYSPPPVKYKSRMHPNEAIFVTQFTMLHQTKSLNDIKVYKSCKCNITALLIDNKHLIHFNYCSYYSILVNKNNLVGITLEL